MLLAQEVANEVARAQIVHSPMHSDHEAYGVIKEEFDELWDEMKMNPKKMSNLERLAWKDRKREEAIQTAAMCVRYILDVIDRR